MNALLTTAMTNTKAFDGTETAGTSLVLVYTFGANGGKLDEITAAVTGANGATASGSTVQNLVRFWLNNGSANTTATNNKLIAEIPVSPVVGVASLGTTSLPRPSKRIGRSYPAGYKIYAGTTVAVGGTNCAILVGATGGDF
jgi:hypothetical protein